MTTRNNVTNIIYKTPAVSFQSFGAVVPSDIPVLNDSLRIAKQLLASFAQSPDFSARMKVAFGQNIDPLKFQTAWQAADFHDLPPIAVRPSDDINGTNGAYAATINTLFLSQEFLSKNADHPDAVASVLLEEIGHYIDAQLNINDSPGDEGAIFSALVRGEALTPQQLAALQAENDTATITLDGQLVMIEQDIIGGTDGSDILYGTQGNDTISGDIRDTGPFFGDDTIYGGDGNDRISDTQISTQISDSIALIKNYKN